MKTKLIILAAVLLATTGIAFAAIHHYGFILSCGKEAYYWADHELSSTELLKITNQLENEHCAKKTIDNNEPLLEDVNRP